MLTDAFELNAVDELMYERWFTTGRQTLETVIHSKSSF
jgi:hypothetical protein